MTGSQCHSPDGKDWKQKEAAVMKTVQFEKNLEKLHCGLGQIFTTIRRDNYERYHDDRIFSRFKF